MGMSITPSDGTGTPSVTTLRRKSQHMKHWRHHHHWHLHVNCRVWCDNKDVLTPVLPSQHCISPVLSLHLVVSVKVEDVFHYFFPPGQQESSWRLLLQSHREEQLRIRLDLHPIHHFGENRKHRGDGCAPAVICETATTTRDVHMFRYRYSNFSMIWRVCQYPILSVGVRAYSNTNIAILQCIYVIGIEPYQYMLISMGTYSMLVDMQKEI